MADQDSPEASGGYAFPITRRVAATVKNVAEVVRFGGLETGEEASPFTVVSEQLTFRLRHYFASDVPKRAQPIVLVPPLMLAAGVWDVSPSSSAVQSLHREGLDVWVVDFGDPRYEPGGSSRNLTDHVLAVSMAVDQVNEATAQDVVLAGYSQGGMFCYQTAAYRRGKGINSVVTFGSPVDARAPLPFPISPEIAARATEGLLESGLLKHINLPSWASRTGFKLLSPAKTVQGQVRFLLALHDRESLLPRERQRRFLEREGFTTWSGPAIAELLELFVAHNRMLAGGFAIDDQMVTLADIDVPILTVVGSTDTIGHPDSVRAIARAAPRSDVYEMTLRAGHFGLVVGSTANNRTWPGVAAWVKWRTDGTPLTGDIVPADQVEHKPMLDAGAGAAALVQAAEFGVGAGLLAFGSAKRAVGMTRGLLTAAPVQLPRLARLELLDQATPMSLGLILEEQARKSPKNTAFLFEDRAYRQGDVKSRVDSVVKGLISVGVRQGDRVGVLMKTRPSAFTVVAALSRLGVTAVMLRPDSELAREAALGQITWVVSDPEHVGGVEILDGVTWCVLGGGAIAGNARFAMATADDPDTFWEEVRRYGATHVAYTWTALRAITLAAPNPGEQHHPIRMFMGSGMPRNLWRRVAERFPTAQVLEFYASAEGEAILANVKGQPIGSMGWPVPGTSEVRIAAFDLDTRSLDLDPDGLCREAATNDVGLLLAKVNSADAMTGIPMRSVFEAGDAWRSTGDLFRKDEHGNFWHHESVSALIETARGIVSPTEVSRELSAIPAVDLCVTFGVGHEGARRIVSAVTVRPGGEILTADLNLALDGLPGSHHPGHVQVVQSIPVTTWHRPISAGLQKAGIPKPTKKRRVWRLDPKSNFYEELS